jgi:hypothetical protein
MVWSSNTTVDLATLLLMDTWASHLGLVSRIRGINILVISIKEFRGIENADFQVCYIMLN